MENNGQIKGGVFQSIPHDSAHLHVTGEAVYVDDIPEIRGTLHGYILKSTKAHANILSIDTSKAEKIDGVRAVLTAKDIPGVNDIAPILKNEPALAEGKVEYIGQPVAVVAAETMKQAQYASNFIDVSYEELEPILSIEKALEKQNYLTAPQTLDYGDSETAINKAENRLQGQLSIGGQDHFYLETHISMAIPKENNEITIYTSTQHPTEGQHGVAHVLGIPFNNVTVEMRRMGGGFGGKESQPTIFAALAALMAWHTKTPVKLRLNRDDDMIITGKRHHYLVKYDVGFNNEGVIEGVNLEYAAGSGSVVDMSPPVVQRTLCHADNCYFLPNVSITGYLCKTNTQPNTAFRGFGGPQGMIGIEHVIESIANKLQIDSLTIRRRNFYGKEDRNITPYEQVVEDNIIHEVVDSVERDSEYQRRKAEIKAFNKQSPVIKKGLAIFPLKFGISFNAVHLNQAGSLVHIYRDGSVLINQGGTEMGQGLLAKMCQVVAEILQVDVENVKICATRTDKVPNTSPTAASSDADMNGMALKNAALILRDRLIAFASEHFKMEKEQVRLDNNKVYAGENILTFKELINLAYMNRISLSTTGFYKTPKIHFDPSKMKGRPFYYFTYGACASEVAIDVLTGETRVLRADILHDCGASLNPALDLGQIEGGYIQGMGWMTMEELWWDDKGDIKTHAPSTYKVPTSRDLPPVFNVKILEDSPNKEDTIFQSKATGEPPLMQGISVWLAVRDAVASIADYKISPELNPPATAECVLKAINDVKSKMS